MLISQLDINYPFVYFDSSCLLRSDNYNVKALTKNSAIKNPSGFLTALNTLKKFSDKDLNYYTQLKYLQDTGKISTIITCETANKIIIQNKMKQISLLGTLSDTINYSTSDIANKRNRGLTLWNEDLDIKIYNQAALIVANATCVICDSCIFKLSACQSIIQYITSSCKLIIVGTNTIKSLQDLQYKTYTSTPEDFINALFSTFN